MSSGRLLDTVREPDNEPPGVARAAVAAAGQWLELRDVVAALDADTDGADAEVATQRGVAIEVLPGAGVDVAVIVSAAAEAEANEWSEVPRGGLVPGGCTKLC